jgi:hypothetical protein
MECKLLLCHNKWGGLVVMILGIQGSIPTNDMGYNQGWNVDQILFTYLSNIGYVLIK